jgi:hypothetical protein
MKYNPFKNNKMPAPNEAVWRNGGISPQKVQCEFGSLYPAGSSVEAATTPSRLDVSRHPCETAPKSDNGRQDLRSR